LAISIQTGATAMNIHRLTEEQKVAYNVAKQRVLACLAQMERRSITLSARHAANVIWPGHKMRAFGAAGAALSVLRKMNKEQLVERVWADRGAWDWRITAKGLRSA
jgi:hypothetical protein